MNKILMLAVVSFGLNALAVDAGYFEIKNIQTREIETSGFQVMDAMGVGPDCGGGSQSLQLMSSSFRTMETAPSVDPLDLLDVQIDKIINIGKKIWNIVQAGKPVMNIKTDVATALPAGVKCWQDLENWSMPESHTYETSFENLYGMTVASFKYRVVFVPGGSFKGAGAYVGYATVLPVEATASWGFSLNAEASVPVVYNMGSKSSPVAAMQVNMKYVVESPLRTIEQGQSYGLNGRGEFKQLD